MFNTKLFTDFGLVRLSSNRFSRPLTFGGSCLRKTDKVSVNVFRCEMCRKSSVTLTPDVYKKSPKFIYQHASIPIRPYSNVTTSRSDQASRKSLDGDELRDFFERLSYDPKVLKLLQEELFIDDVMAVKILDSFHTSCASTEVIPLDLNGLLYDLIRGAGTFTDLVPYLVQHARSVYPHLDVTTNLKHLIATNMVDPVNWYPETRKMQRTIIYHCGPTNSGKTYAALKRFMDAKTGVYLAPLRLLAIECFTKTNEQDVPCDLLTGERKYYIESEDSPANHRACTIELLDFSSKYDVAVIDEIQMIGDLFRGGYWTQSLLGVMAQEVHVCGDGSALEIVEKLVKQCGDSFEVRKYERKTPLVIEEEPLGSLSNVRPGDCIVCFQVKQLFSVGEQLKNLGHNCALIYGALPPGIKINQTEMFNDPSNSCNVLVATDAVGMGLNLAIQRIIFYDVEKFGLKENSKEEAIDRYTKEKMMLNTSQAKQIAGRAGRYGKMYEKKGGQVTALHSKDLDRLREVLMEEIPKIDKAGLALREDILETFSYYLPGTVFSDILKKFITMCETDGEYFMCDMSPLVKNALLIDHIDMPLRDKLIFCQVPMGHAVTPRVIAIYVQMARHVSQGHPMTLNWFLRATGFSRSELLNMKHFDDALEIFHLTDIYLWLSYKFPVFQTIESMRTFRLELDKALRNYIELNYTSINKGKVLQLAASGDMKKLIAERGTFDDVSKETAMDEYQGSNGRKQLKDAVKRSYDKSDHMNLSNHQDQEKMYSQSLSTSMPTVGSSDDERLSGLMYFLLENGFDIKEGSLKWRRLSPAEQGRYIRASASSSRER